MIDEWLFDGVPERKEGHCRCLIPPEIRPDAADKSRRRDLFLFPSLFGGDAGALRQTISQQKTCDGEQLRMPIWALAKCELEVRPCMRPKLKDKRLRLLFPTILF
jgi:hypothetical protein